MKTRQQVIDHCKTFPAAYEDYPFDDPNWTVMRRLDTRRGFAWIYERNGCIWVNVKTDPASVSFWTGAYEAIVPAYHMNKRHWISLILDGTLPTEEITERIRESYDRCGK